MKNLTDFCKTVETGMDPRLISVATWYKVNCAFCSRKKYWNLWNGWAVQWCSYNEKNITWPLWGSKFLFSCARIILFHSFTALTQEIFWTLKMKFPISTQPCYILLTYFLCHFVLFQNEVGLSSVSVCPGGEHQCPVDHSCCPILGSSHFHCCPSGYSCDQGVCQEAKPEFPAAVLNKFSAKVVKCDKKLACPDR